jgi:hypothetical protein
MRQRIDRQHIKRHSNRCLGVAVSLTIVQPLRVCRHGASSSQAATHDRHSKRELPDIPLSYDATSVTISPFLKKSRSDPIGSTVGVNTLFGCDTSTYSSKTKRPSTSTLRLTKCSTCPQLHLTLSQCKHRRPIAHMAALVSPIPSSVSYCVRRPVRRHILITWASTSETSLTTTQSTSTFLVSTT